MAVIGQVFVPSRFTLPPICIPITPIVSAHRGPLSYLPSPYRLLSHLISSSCAVDVAGNARDDHPVPLLQGATFASQLLLYPFPMSDLWGPGSRLVIHSMLIIPRGCPRQPNFSTKAIVRNELALSSCCAVRRPLEPEIRQAPIRRKLACLGFRLLPEQIRLCLVHLKSFRISWEIRGHLGLVSLTTNGYRPLLPGLVLTDRKHEFFSP